MVNLLKYTSLSFHAKVATMKSVILGYWCVIFSLSNPFSNYAYRENKGARFSYYEEAKQARIKSLTSPENFKSLSDKEIQEKGFAYIISDLEAN